MHLFRRWQAGRTSLHRRQTNYIELEDDGTMFFVEPDKTSVNYEFWLEIDVLGDTRSAIASRSSIMVHVGEN